MRTTCFNYSGMVSLLLLLFISNRIEAGAFVRTGALPLHRRWTNCRHLDDLAPPLFSSIHHPDTGDEILFPNAEIDGRVQQQSSPALFFPVFPAIVSVVLLSVAICAASLGQNTSLLDSDSQTDYPSSRMRTSQETSIVQREEQAQPEVTADQVVWTIDGSDGFFFY